MIRGNIYLSSILFFPFPKLIGKKTKRLREKHILFSFFDSTSVNNIPVKSFPVKIAQKESNNLVFQIWIINSNHGHMMERGTFRKLDLTCGQVFRGKVRESWRSVYRRSPGFIARKTKEMNKTASKKARAVHLVYNRVLSLHRFWFVIALVSIREPTWNS